MIKCEKELKEKIASCTEELEAKFKEVGATIELK